MVNEHEASIDILKGFAILCVVLGHINCVPPVKNFIYSFHMLLFMFLSGMTFYYSYTKYINKIDNPIYIYIYIYRIIRGKAAALMLPYIFWSGFNTVFFQNSMRIYDVATAPFDMANFSKLWFLPTLFFISVIFCILQALLLLMKKEDSYILEMFLLVIMIAMHIVLLRYSGWKIFREILIYILPFYFGFAVKKYKRLANILSHTLVSSFCLLGFLFFTKMYDSTDKSLTILLIRFLSGIVFTVPIYNYVSQKEIPKKLSCYLIFFGKHTLAVYVLHEYLRFIFVNTVYGDIFIDTIARICIAIIITFTCICIKHILSIAPQLSLIMFGVRYKK